MRADGRRTKKLILAFQFQYANRAAWKCESCRRKGLEEKRRCGWLPRDEWEKTPAIVWARGKAVAHRCPVSMITAQSICWIEEFRAWKLLGGVDYTRMSAKTVDAFCVLETEWRTEAAHGEE